ncbi:unnamed protein product [Laminaria digitata]
MYEAWTADPGSVHKSWDAYFRHSDAGRDGTEAFTAPPRVIEVPSAMMAPYSPLAEALPVTGQSDSLALSYLIRAYQVG